MLVHDVEADGGGSECNARLGQSSNCQVPLFLLLGTGGQGIAEAERGVKKCTVRQWCEW